ncbi:putative helix loop helix domain containing protein [Lyophyllum shimeji]|uniref:Helix loop helix domain containing protein n=1 Tax=Lyophyllum shimeji TaxID=47721 RepID=A0A9P3PR66_LYOSH|nr:putative helix loop helix domain containing protein [Lyophyllum shimeji]
MDSMSPASLASLSSLLTPSESHAFHSFLSSMNGPPAHDEWIDADLKDKQALAKATKDLMSLDTQFVTHNDALFNYLPSAPSSSHHPQVLLPHPPHSDSSSRTPTPTSVPPFPFHQPLSGRQPSRTRPSHPHPYPITPAAPKLRRASQSQSQASSSAPPKPPQPPQKPALLTPSQKKANHIQSEQKRRANIRRGYEALCECVPALREAIREEEEALAAVNDTNARGGANGTAKRKGKVAVKNKDGEEKVDGRAGPRSENVVLSKTIDYINELLDERSALLARLHRARSTLPPGHPALIPPRYSNPKGEAGGEEEGPLWEREWKGGHGMLGNTCDDGDESS